MAKKRAAAPVDNIETWELARLVPYANNPRLHSPEQVDQLAASMDGFKQTSTVLVDEKGEIIAGHGRVLAAQKLGWKQIRVAIAIGWSDEQKKAYRIADNQLALTSRWDQELLSGELKLLKADDFDLSTLGFDPGYLEGLLMAGGTGDNPLEEWNGMPGFEHGDKRAFKSVIVHFKDQAAVEKFEKLIGRKLTNRYLWYPEIEIDLAHDKRYVSAK